MIRALICDIYGTLLEVGPPPPRAEASWNFLWHSFVHVSPPPTLKEFSLAVEPLIAHHHALGRARGLVQPEVDWPALASHGAFWGCHPIKVHFQAGFCGAGPPAAN